MNYFYCDIHSDIKITWETFSDDLRKYKKYNPYCYHDDFYEIFKHIVLSILIGEEIILLDGDFTSQEVIKLTGHEELSASEKLIDNRLLSRINSRQDILDRFSNVDKNWSMTLFTSGTTGLPKKVTHSYNSITRFVKSSPKYESNIWGFAYNPTHMAGIQVFFQALLNGNSIVKLFGFDREHIYSSIETFGITNISATPTFYRLLLPASGSYPSVIRITSGGEKFDENIIANLTHLFPHAKVTNVYASTEAGTLFAAEGNIFSIKPEMTPFLRIVDNELHIHENMMGASQLEYKEWYHTGDLVEIVSEDPLQFRFLTRKNEMINVGGYKVNPEEVEDTIRGMTGIKDVRVYAKSNSVLGNIVCCEIVKIRDELDESTIRSYLQKNLQEFKIPRFMKFIDEIATTRTGKIKRR